MAVLSTVESQCSAPIISRRQRTKVAEILRELEQMHSSLRNGDGFPSRRELVEQLDTSERAVREALSELERQGKIIRRVGRGGSIVAKSQGGIDDGAIQKAALNGGVLSSEEADRPEGNSVLAIGEPDGGIFDQAMRVLMKQAKTAELEVHCRFMQPDELPRFAVPRLESGQRKFVVFRRHFLPLADRLQAAGHRVVFIGTPFTAEIDTEVPSVFGDQEHGGYLATRHLIDLGHRRLAFHVGDMYRQVRRWTGWRRAIDEAREHGLELQEEILDLEIGERWRSQHELAQAYFARLEAPTGIVSWNDDTALEMLTLLQRSGLRVPEDVSIVGYDNLKRGAEVHPALTTVDGGLDIQIQSALRLLSRAKLAPSHQTIVTPTLVPRDSTAPPAR